MSKLVTIYGGAGFVGRYITRRLAQDGWRIRVAMRRPNEALFVKPYGAVGQVEPVACNIRDDASVRAAMRGADVVINCVGIMNGLGRNSFDAVQNQGAGRIARIAAAEGVARLVHLSAIGADAGSDSQYLRSKAEGEAAILAAFPQAVILRPSVIFGPEDRFFNRFAGMARFTAVLPLVGADNKFQPVYVDDVARAAVAAVYDEAAVGIYELGGADVASFRDLIKMTLRIIRRRRLVVNLPSALAGLAAIGCDSAQILTGGLIENRILTRDQLRILLRHDNIVSPGAKGLADLGVTPTSTEAVVQEYLWRHRPAGQYEAIKESAKALRNA